MSDVLHRTTKEFRTSVHQPLYSESEWVIEPLLKDGTRLRDALAKGAVELGYLMLDWDVVRGMTAEERAEVDEQRRQDAILARRNQILEVIDSREPIIAAVKGQAAVTQIEIQGIKDGKPRKKSTMEELTEEVRQLVRNGAFD